MTTTTDLPLFAPLPPMVRRRDGATSRDAAARVRSVRGPIHQQVLAAIRAAGADGLTDRELELLPVFAALAPSSARKRRSELYHVGALRPAGVRDRLTIWVVAEAHATDAGVTP